MSDIRRVRLVVGHSMGSLPVLLFACLVPACSGDVETDPNATGSTVGAAGAGGAPASSSSPAGGGGAGGAGGSVSFGGAGGTAPAAPCPPYAFEQTFVVEIPPEGVPATVGQICSVVVPPVESNRAARVTLAMDGSAPSLAKGEVAVEPALLPSVVGTPVVEVVSSAAPELSTMTVTNVAKTAGGFSFDATWPPFSLLPEPWVAMRVRVTLELACEPPGLGTRTVESDTIIHLCIEGDELAWVSSGDDCKVCQVVAEMAPSPIAPGAAADELPLSRALRLRAVLIGRVGRTLLLWAEHGGGTGLSYEWHPSSGELTRLADDVVAWTPAVLPGPHLLQVAAHGDDRAAVASFTWSEAAGAEAA